MAMKRKAIRAASKTAKYDSCQTPPYAVEPLLPFLKPQWTIWEPACGEGLLQRALEAAGRRVVGTDYLTGHDFFDHIEESDVVVTNPPYSIKYDWLERCYQLCRPFALLVPVETIGAASAQRLMAAYGAEILLLNRRVNFKMPNAGWSGGGAQFPVLWLCWQLLPAPIMYGSIVQQNADQLALFDPQEVANATL